MRGVNRATGPSNRQADLNWNRSSNESRHPILTLTGWLRRSQLHYISLLIADSILNVRATAAGVSRAGVHHPPTRGRGPCRTARRLYYVFCPSTSGSGMLATGSELAANSVDVEPPAW
jgi:hypothetical protein